MIKYAAMLRSFAEKMTNGGRGINIVTLSMIIIDLDNSFDSFVVHPNREHRTEDALIEHPFIRFLPSGVSRLSRRIASRNSVIHLRAEKSADTWAQY